MDEGSGGGGRRRLLALVAALLGWRACVYVVERAQEERSKIKSIEDVPETAMDLLRRLNWTSAVEEHLESMVQPSARVSAEAPKHPLVLVPGIISCGLELWRPGACFGKRFFRERLWGGLGMARTAMANISCWLDHVSLDPSTGLDREGQAVRAALGWAGADYFAPGYWLWSKLLSNAAALGYDRSTMHVACYDWRLSFRNLERRDQFLTRLKAEVEILAAAHDKVVVVGHSMGATLVTFFLSWCELGDPGWTDRHVHAVVSLGGSLLGAVGPLGAVLSGEMKATAMLGMLNELIDSQLSFLNKTRQRDIYRSLGAMGALLPKGGDALWGDDLVSVRTAGAGEADEADEATFGVDAIRAALAAELPDGASILDYDPRPRWPSRRPRVGAGAAERLAAASENPLNAPLPAAPNLTVYCLYGTRVPTEIRYKYARDGAPPTAAELGTIDYALDDGTYESGVENGTHDQCPNVPELLVLILMPCR